jgi:hypothetical protein
MGDRLHQRSGYRKFNNLEGVGFRDFNRIGTAGLAALTDLVLARLLRQPGSDVPPSGVLGGDDLAVAITDTLEVTVSPGVALYFDTTLDPTDGGVASDDALWTPVYRPIVVSVAEVLTLATADATNPRIDRIVIRPAWEDEQQLMRDVRTGAPGTETTQPFYTRSGLSFELDVIEGTPAGSPSTPALPSGWLGLATVRVAASTGVLSSLTDSRVRIGTLGQGMMAPLAQDHTTTEAWVVSGGVVSAGTGLSVDVTAGSCYIDGINYPFALANDLALPAAHATLDRIDTIGVDRTGTVRVTEGTPDASPTAPALGYTGVVLAYVEVDATDTTPTAIIDERADHLTFLSESRVDFALERACLNVTIAARDALESYRTVTVQAVRPDGSALRRNVQLLARVWGIEGASALNQVGFNRTDLNLALSFSGTPAEQQLDSDTHALLLLTNDDGQATFRLSKSGGTGEQYGWLEIEVIRRALATADGSSANSTITPGGVSPSYMPGDRVLFEVAVSEP